MRKVPRSIPHSIPLVMLVVVACKDEKPADPPRLRKMDFKVTVDPQGRLRPEIELYDQRHARIAVEGSYTLTLRRPDGTTLCTASQPIAKEAYDGTRLALDWSDAKCPADPGGSELVVVLAVKTGDKPEDAKLEREKVIPTKFVYRHLTATPPGDAGVDGAAPDAGAAAPDAATATPDAAAAPPAEKPAP